MMPRTCFRLIENVRDTTNQTARDKHDGNDDLSSFCSYRAAVTSCISEQAMEMRYSSNPIVWGFGVTFQEGHVMHKCEQTCRLYEDLRNTPQFQCIGVTKKNTELCETKLKQNLQYLRDNMDDTGPLVFREHNVCSAFREYLKCQNNAISDICSDKMIFLLSLSSTLFARLTCNNPERNLQIHRMLVEYSAFAKCGVPKMNFYWTEEISVDLRALFTSVSRSCEHLDNMYNCLTSKLVEPKSHIDKIASDAVNIETVMKALGFLCHSAHISSVDNQQKCLYEVNTYSTFCNVFTKAAYISELKTGQENLLCSHYRDLISCFSIQIRRCDASLADDFKKAYMLQMDNDKCRNKTFPTMQLGGSTLIHCGAAVATKTLAARNTIRDLKNQSNSLTSSSVIEHISGVLGTLVDFTCNELPSYLSCISVIPDIPENKLDRLIKSIVRLDNTLSITSAMTTLCEHRDRIRENMECFVRKESDFYKCAENEIHSIYIYIHNTTLLGANHSNVTALCNHIHQLTECATNMAKSCDHSLGLLLIHLKQTLIREEKCVVLDTLGSRAGANHSHLNSIAIIVLICLTMIFII